jgi:phosphotransferase system enzyme I (PtsP)
LVVQRRTGAFDLADVELLVALGALIAAGVRHAELIDAQREKKGGRFAEGGTRKATLAGRPAYPGRAIGAIAALRRPSPRPSEPRVANPDSRQAGQAGERRTEPTPDARRLTGAFDVAQKAIAGLRRRADELHLGADASFLATFTEILGDQRFRGRTLELVEQGVGIGQALAQVAREATRAAVSFTRDPFLEERAHDIEDLCDALTMLAQRERRPELPTKAMLVGDRLTVYDVLVSARAQPAGVALSERATGPRTAVLLALLGRPAVVEVHGLFRWASDGDVALLDADHGLLILNPSKGEVASLREHKRGLAKG